MMLVPVGLGQDLFGGEFFAHGGEHTLVEQGRARQHDRLATGSSRVCSTTSWTCRGRSWHPGGWEAALTPSPLPRPAGVSSCCPTPSRTWLGPRSVCSASVIRAWAEAPYAAYARKFTIHAGVNYSADHSSCLRMKIDLQLHIPLEVPRQGCRRTPLQRREGGKPNRRQHRASQAQKVRSYKRDSMRSHK